MAVAVVESRPMLMSCLASMVILVFAALPQVLVRTLNDRGGSAYSLGRGVVVDRVRWEEWRVSGHSRFRCDGRWMGLIRIRRAVVWS